MASGSSIGTLVDERAPLLTASNPNPESDVNSGAQLTPSPPRPPHRSPTLVVVLILLYLALLDLGYELIMPAQTRVLERIFCKQYYEAHDPSLIGSDGRDGVDERWCKIKPVQEDVAMLKGWQVSFDSIGSRLANS